MKLNVLSKMIPLCLLASISSAQAIELPATVILKGAKCNEVLERTVDWAKNASNCLYGKYKAFGGEERSFILYSLGSNQDHQYEKVLIWGEKVSHLEFNVIQPRGTFPGGLTEYVQTEIGNFAFDFNEGNSLVPPHTFSPNKDGQQIDGIPGEISAHNFVKLIEDNFTLVADLKSRIGKHGEPSLTEIKNQIRTLRSRTSKLVTELTDIDANLGNEMRKRITTVFPNN
jgi:hypothetical protein